MILPIQVYTREGCGLCAKLKSDLNALGVPFIEYELDKDITATWFKENYPGKNLLPTVVTEEGVYSGPIETGHLLSEYRQDVGKRLLNEDDEPGFAM